jgi:hypothetical protein
MLSDFYMIELIKEPDERPRLICIRIADAQEHVEGADPGKCDGCGEPIWIAPTSFKLIIEDKALPTCMQCVVLNPKWQTEEIKALTPEQQEEIIVNLKRLAKEKNERGRNPI